jgi:hypothetical protein
MGKLVDSKERSAGEFILFALGFVGFVIGATGIVVGSAGGSVFGWLLLLFVVSCFMFRSTREVQ